MISLKAVFSQAATDCADRTNFYRLLFWALSILNDAQRRDKDRRTKRNRAASPPRSGPRPF